VPQPSGRRSPSVARRGTLPARVGERSDRLRFVPQQLTESIADWIRQANEQVSDQLRLIPQRLAESIVDRVRQANQQMGEWLHSVTREFIQRAQEAFARLDAALRDTLQTLGMNGWYPDDEIDMPGLLDFTKGFDLGEEEKTNEALCQHFEARSEAIVNDLVVMTPKRERFLRTALEAHRDQKYELSIPVFLAQADGMWQDFTKASAGKAGKEMRLYSRSRKTGRPHTAKWVESVKSDERGDALLYPLVVPIPISASDEEVVLKGALVRQVLHGTDGSTRPSQ